MKLMLENTCTTTQTLIELAIFCVQHDLKFVWDDEAFIIPFKKEK